MVDEAEAEMSPQEPRLTTVADFDATYFEAPIRDSNLADAHDMYGLYERAFAAAQAASDDAGQAVYRLLAQVCSIALRPSDEGNNWLPLLSFTDGTHSPVTEDFRGAQTELLRNVARLSKTPALRARLSDIAWSNNRRDGASATSAIKAYCETVDGLLDGHLTSLYGLNAGMAAKTPMHRALQIAWLTTKATSRPEIVIDRFDRLYTSVRDRGDVGILVHLARLALQFRLKDAAALAPELEQAAKAVPHGSFPMAVKSAWDMAARLYDSLKDPEARQRCLMGGVEQLLAMRGQVSTAGAEASWVMDALQLLRHVQGQEELELKLEAELRRLQKASMKQMAMFEVDLEVGDKPRKVAEHFERLSLSDALRAFAILDRSRDVDKLRADAVALGETAPLMATMATSFIDNDGRTVKKSRGAPHEGEPDDVWFTHMIERSESIHRHRTIAALIEPARLAIQARYGLVSDHFQAMVASCPFVPESQRELVALGFARLFQGDFMSATHLLIPQLEPCLRHLLKINGADPSKRSDDSTEQDLSLKNIYVRFREELEAMLTPDLAWEIDRLFNTRPGPALRHEVAHGQLSGGDCFHPNVYYANWLIYRVCCLFAFPSWDELVAPDFAE